MLDFEAIKQIRSLTWQLDDTTYRSLTRATMPTVVSHWSSNWLKLMTAVREIRPLSRCWSLRFKNRCASRICSTTGRSWRAFAMCAGTRGGW